MSTTNDTAQAAKEQASQVAGTGKEQAGAVASTAAGAAKDVTSTATEQAKNVVGEATQQARDLVGEARTQVQTQASAQTQKVAQTVRSFADELHGIARGEAAPSGTATEVLHRAASRGTDLAGYLENAEPAQILDDLRQMARRKPGLFLLGAGAAGFAVARLTKGAKQATSDASDYSTSRSLPARPTGYVADTSYAVGPDSSPVTSYGTGAAYAVDSPYATDTGYTTDTAYESAGATSTDATYGAGTAAGYPTEVIDEPVLDDAPGYSTIEDDRDRGRGL